MIVIGQETTPEPVRDARGPDTTQVMAIEAGRAEHEVDQDEDQVAPGLPVRKPTQLAPEAGGRRGVMCRR